MNTPNPIHLRELALHWSRCSIQIENDDVGKATAMCQSLLSTCPNIQKLSVDSWLSRRVNEAFVNLAMNLHHLRFLKLDLIPDQAPLECFSQYESLPSLTCLGLCAIDNPHPEMLHLARAFPNTQRLMATEVVEGEGVWQLAMAFFDLRFLHLEFVNVVTSRKGSSPYV
eukprot:TRINITY_DN2422_c0_g1_i2.p1 TRINITY_DN2422_c0_g1~~TRINITY_DN2422_c0_g1_i2.p1  ORF type:complete len:169 (-),score=2.85 TRINITY_DN2422_c0_g1_i2:417-923(-)